MEKDNIIRDNFGIIVMLLALFGKDINIPKEDVEKLQKLINDFDNE